MSDLFEHCLCNGRCVICIDIDFTSLVHFFGVYSRTHQKNMLGTSFCMPSCFPHNSFFILHHLSLGGNWQVYSLVTKKIKKHYDTVIWLQVFNCFGHQFCLHFEAFNIGMAPVYIAFLRFMGDDHEAKRFSYSLEVSGGGRKMQWHGVPRSIRDSHKTVRDSLDGLIIQRRLALFFSGGDGQELKLKIAGRIWKEQL